MKFSSPAKLNLNLHIVGQRDDGYHLLETYFQLLDFGDELEIKVNHSGDISLYPDIPGVPKKDNLIFRAANALREHVQRPDLGANVRLKKQLPIGGGLGGGSSNAATALLALNKLWDLGLSRQTLEDLGRKLGADVPVFVKGFSAWATGIGDQLEPYEIEHRWYVVLRPPVAVSTADIFQHPELTRDTPSITVAAVLDGHGHNDCEPVVRATYPVIDQGLSWLQNFAPAQLTGTGSCIFAAFKNKTDADEVLNCKPEGYDGFVAKGVFASPINAQID